jgi:hypothetical protein
LSESNPGTTDDGEGDADLESPDRDDDEDGRDDEPAIRVNRERVPRSMVRWRESGAGQIDI